MGFLSPKVPDLPPAPPAPPPPPDASEESILAQVAAMQTMAKSRLGYKTTFAAGARGTGRGMPPGNPVDQGAGPLGGATTTGANGPSPEQQSRIITAGELEPWLQGGPLPAGTARPAPLRPGEVRNTATTSPTSAPRIRPRGSYLL